MSISAAASDLQLMLNPPENSIIFQNDLVYAALAKYPLTKGHTIVAWKKPISDLGKLTSEEYAYLMLTVDKVRNALMENLKVKKVYLFYMDEIQHVHWHLIPRYSIFGLTILKNKPKMVNRFPLAAKLRSRLSQVG